MKIPSVNISPRVQCGKTAGKTRVSVTQLNSKLHCGDFVRMFILTIVEPAELKIGAALQKHRLFVFTHLGILQSIDYTY